MQLGHTAAVLGLLVLTLASTAGAAASCPADSADCAVTDQPVPVSGSALLSRLSPTTRRLTLRNVSLRDWPDSAVGMSAQLETLELDSVSLDSVSIQQLPGRSMPALRVLRIRGSGSGGGGCPFGGGFAGFANLREAAVSGCRLGTALTAAWLKELPRLERLSVDSAKVDSVRLATLPEDTRRSLRDLRLTANSINSLMDDAFGHMPNLLNLTLDGNIIQYIQPGVFSQLPALRELSIVLPKEGQMAKIWEPQLDGRFDNNTQLETLRLVNARLAEEQILSTFEHLKQLRVLDLSGNRFRRLYNSVLSSLTSLQVLDLSNGSLTCLYDRNFGVMGRLRRLSLASNEIRVIGKRALLGLQSLTSLDLSNNPIEAIELGAFCTLKPQVREFPLSAWGLDPGAVEGSANVSDPCPKDLNPDRLILSSKPQCLMPRPKTNVSDTRRPQEPSRHTFLIIIGLCVAFLLVTVIAMMAYKGWSKRKNAQLAKDEEKELELQAMVSAAAEGGAAGTGPTAEVGAGTKRPHNGQRHRHRQQQKADSPKEPLKEPLKEAQVETQVETTAQVESPDRCADAAAAAADDNAAAAAGPATPEAVAKQQPAQMRPGVSLMTTVPEDSDLEARAITTLVVV